MSNPYDCGDDPTLVPPGYSAPPRRAAELDSQPIGQLQSTTIIAALTGIVSLLASFGVKWGLSDTDMKKIAEGVLALVSLGSFVWAWIGRVRATKQVSATRLVTEASKTTLPCLLLLFMCTGCLGNLKQSPLIQIYTAKQAYAVSLDEFKSGVDSGMINNPTVLKTAYALIPEITKTLNDATLKAKMGDTIGYQFLWEQLQDKLTRFLQLQAPANRSPSSFLMERDLCPLWHLLPSSLRDSLVSSSFSRPSRPSSRAALLAKSSRLWLTYTCSSPRMA